MPFTLAHPAAVLPLMRRPMVALALVCGALAPDIPYYVRATRIPVSAQSWYEPFTNATTSHSLAGLLTVALPLALALYLLLLAATPPVEWLVRGRTGTDGATPVPAGRARGWAHWAWVAVSLVIGAATHLLWDSLTSADGFLAARFNGLNESAVRSLTWVSLLGHASSVLGLVAIAVVAWRHRRAFTGDAAPLPRAYWALAGLVTIGLLAGAAAVLARLDLSVARGNRELVESVLTVGLIQAGAAVGVTMVLATSVWWVAQLRTTTSPTAAGKPTNAENA